MTQLIAYQLDASGGRIERTAAPASRIECGCASYCARNAQPTTARNFRISSDSTRLTDAACTTAAAGRLVVPTPSARKAYAVRCGRGATRPEVGATPTTRATIQTSVAAASTATAAASGRKADARTN